MQLPGIDSRYANGSMTEGSFEKARKGIAIPRLIDIPPGTTLYRFVDMNRGGARTHVANSPWWFEYEYFMQVKGFAERHGHTLDHCARLFLAVLHEYSDITGYIHARVTKPLKAWKGEGNVVYSSGKDPRDPRRMIPMQSINKIYQLYIPGLYRDSPLLGQAFGPIEYMRTR